MRTIFYRNDRARDLLDAFFVSAVSCVLLVRFYLHITGYPQIGGGTLHIAHMLYGGILMLVAIVATLTFLGSRVRQLVAILGGIGFGLFIDEVGKFITKDNDYFFEPTIGIIYATFVVLYLVFNFLTRHQRLTSREYQLNALNELEDAIANDLDRDERANIRRLLKSSDQNSKITKHLLQFVDTLPVTAPVKPDRLARFVKKVDDGYSKFWKQRNSRLAVRFIFVAQIAVLLAGILYTIYTSVDDVQAFFNDQTFTYGRDLIIGQIIASIVSAAYVVRGLLTFTASRYEAFEQFRRATLINIYLTQFFVFVRVQFEALPGFALSLLLLLVITFVLRQERRLGNTHAQTQR